MASAVKVKKHPREAPEPGPSPRAADPGTPAHPESSEMPARCAWCTSDAPFSMGAAGKIVARPLRGTKPVGDGYDS